MNFLEDLVRFSEHRRLIAIIVPHDRYEDVRRFMASTVYAHGNWDRERLSYRGAPFVRTEFSDSYVIEDTPDGPMVHMLR